MNRVGQLQSQTKEPRGRHVDRTLTVQGEDFLAFFECFLGGYFLIDYYTFLSRHMYFLLYY